MTTMASLVRQNRPAAEVMDWVRRQDAKRGRNEPCPCGGGRKFIHCHGQLSHRNVDIDGMSKRNSLGQTPGGS
ncbi:SEC-C metal-binding domain-containing protein [Methylocystis sp.]|uniref:SEC-C metal-binding domain-containing protein n=2 Tax=Methylocystis sp. TaxID=1911079 RepID=UPI003D0DC50B